MSDTLEPSNICPLCGENEVFVNSKGITGNQCQLCYENTCMKCGDEIDGRALCRECGRGGQDIEDYEPEVKLKYKAFDNLVNDFIRNL